MSKNVNGSRITSLCHNYYKLVKISKKKKKVTIYMLTLNCLRNISGTKTKYKKVTVPDESNLPRTTHNYFPLDFFS